MLERQVSQAELIDLIETGDIKYRSETHWWFYKDLPGRGDNLVCAAVQKGQALIVKTVMINWRLEDE